MCHLTETRTFVLTHFRCFARQDAYRKSVPLPNGELAICDVLDTAVRRLKIYQLLQWFLITNGKCMYRGKR